MNDVSNGLKGNLRKKVNENIECRQWHSSIVLEGEADNWEQVVAAGKMAAGKGYKGVVNKLNVKGIEIPAMRMPKMKDEVLEGRKVDVLIIGGGIIGCSIGRELSKWNMSVLLVDKEADLAMHASSRNDGMIHPGIEPRAGSKRCLFNVRGNEMYSEVARNLDVHMERCGSTILMTKGLIKAAYPIAAAKAKKVGVTGMKLLSRKEVLAFEPNINAEFSFGVHFSTTGVTSPYKMTFAYAENAMENGMEISLDTAVTGMEKEGDRIVKVSTNRGAVYPRMVINAAGVFSDVIADMAGDQFFSIHPRKGEILFLDKKKGALINGVIARPVLSSVKSNTKGGGIVRTIDGNVLVGPDAYEQPFKEDFSTNMGHLEALMKKHLPLVKGFSPADVITYCAGVRAATYEEDFIIEASEYVDNLVHAAGIQSPGFASAPAIALEIEKITVEKLSKIMDVRRKENFREKRKSRPDLSRMTSQERSELIKRNPDYGVIVCRCEGISKGEIEDAVSSLVPANTVDGVKRRVRAGMGRCQGGFCMPTVMKIIEEKTGTNMLDITKKGNGSRMLSRKLKEVEKHEHI